MKKSLTGAVTAISFLGLCIPFMAYAAGEVELTLSPKEGTYEVGDTVEVKVLLDTAEKESDQVDLILEYDPSLLEVVDKDETTEGVQVTGGDLFEVTLQNEVDQENNTILFSQVSLVPDKYYTTGSEPGEVAVIEFEAKKAGAAEVKFSFDPQATENTDDTNILDASSDKDMLQKVTDAIFTIEDTGSDTQVAGDTDTSETANDTDVTGEDDAEETQTPVASSGDVAVDKLALLADGKDSAIVTVTVTDSSGAVVANEEIDFRLTSGDGHLDNMSGISDIDGQVAVNYIAGTVPGPVSIVATVRDNPTISIVANLEQVAPFTTETKNEDTAPPTPEPTPTEEAPQDLADSGPEMIVPLLLAPVMAWYVMRKREEEKLW